MAKTTKKITCKAYIRVDGELVDVDTLNPLQKNYLGAKLQESMLNTMYRGRVEFKADLPPKEEVFPKTNQEKKGENHDNTVRSAS